MMKQFAVVMLIAAFSIGGCGREPATPIRWRVDLVRPDGETQKSWTVKSRRMPTVKPYWGGQVVLYRDNGDGFPESFGLLAPTGWMFECTRLPAKPSSSKDTK